MISRTKSGMNTSNLDYPLSFFEATTDLCNVTCIASIISILIDELLISISVDGYHKTCIVLDRLQSHI